jgi:hypothetical protein
MAWALTQGEVGRLRAALKRDRLGVHPLLTLLWRRGWLLAPTAFRWPVLLSALGFALWLTFGMTVQQVSGGLGLLLSVAVLALLASGVAVLENRWSLPRSRSDLLLVLAALVAGLCWYDGRDLTVWQLFGDQAPALAWSGRDMLLGFAATFSVSLIFGLIGAWLRRPYAGRQAASWPAYVEASLAAGPLPPRHLSEVEIVKLEAALAADGIAPGMLRGDLWRIGLLTPPPAFALGVTWLMLLVAEVCAVAIAVSQGWISMFAFLILTAGCWLCALFDQADARRNLSPVLRRCLMLAIALATVAAMLWQGDRLTAAAPGTGGDISWSLALGQGWIYVIYRLRRPWRDGAGKMLPPWPMYIDAALADDVVWMRRPGKTASLHRLQPSQVASVAAGEER